MELSQNGLNLIKQFEGCRLTAYKDVGGTWTIGYGHTGSDVYEGLTITQEQADALLYSDCAGFVAKVNKYQSIYNFNQNEFDALVSFCYNIGNISGVTCNGTLPKEEIPDMMFEYVYAKGVKYQGLVNRRTKEVELFKTPITTQAVYSKSNEEVAKEVIAGLWGNGDDRKTRLANAGYDYNTIQSIVNNLLSSNTSNRKSNEEIAKEVVQGLWGNGADRRTRLTNAGYDYKSIQSLVNNMLK